MNQTAVSVSLVIVSVMFSSAGQTLLKLGLDRSGSGDATGLMNFLWLAFTNWLVWAGLVLFGLSVIVWMKVLSTSQLSWGYPLLGLSYVFVALAGWLVFGENIGAVRMIGIGFVILGAVLIGSS